VCWETAEINLVWKIGEFGMESRRYYQLRRAIGCVDCFCCAGGGASVVVVGKEG